MSESFQPVPAWSGCTNSVQAYCRFAIMTIATSDALSWNQRLLMFTSAPRLTASASQILREIGLVLSDPLSLCAFEAPFQLRGRKSAPPQRCNVAQSVGHRQPGKARRRGAL